MKVSLFKKDNEDIAFKFENDETEYSFDEGSVFKYIDAIIENDYEKIPIEYNQEIKELKPYADLFAEIYNDIIDPKNRFKEAYEEYISAKKIADEANQTIAEENTNNDDTSQSTH